MTLLEQLRELGLPMGSCYAPREQEERNEDGTPTGETLTITTHVGWTTDEAKATKAQELGATLRAYTSTDARFKGWEVSCHEVER